MHEDFEPYLQNPAVSDEVLLKNISAAVQLGAGTKNKMAKGSSVTMSGSKKNKRHTPKPDPILEKPFNIYTLRLLLKLKLTR